MIKVGFFLSPTFEWIGGINYFRNLFAAINEVNDKNKILEGLSNSAQTTTDVILDEYKNQEPKVFIEAGKVVLIFFMEGMNAY